MVFGPAGGERAVDEKAPSSIVDDVDVGTSEPVGGEPILKQAGPG